MLRPIRAFLALHKHGTVAAAAEEVHLSAAAVSVQLKMLEERLGAELFTRSKRSLALTPMGHRLVPLAQKLMSTYEEMQQLSDGELHGRIALGVLASALTGIFPAVMLRLKAETPRLDIRLVTGPSADLIAQVEAGLLDAAVVTQPPRHFVTKLVLHRLYTEPFALITPGAMRRKDLARTMATAPYIALDRNSWVGQAIDEHLAKAGIHVHTAMELNSQDAVLTMVSHGLGVTILPVRRGAAHARNPGLRITPLRGFSRAVCLAERKAHPHSDLTRKLIETIGEVARSGIDSAAPSPATA